MPEEELKEHNQTVGSLQTLAEGAKTHAADTDKKCPVNAEEVLADKTELQTGREVYKTSETETRRLYDAYEAILKSKQAKYSQYIDLLHGTYGKKNQILTDFGVKPNQSGGKKGPRTNNQSKPQ